MNKFYVDIAKREVVWLFTTAKDEFCERSISFTRILDVVEESGINNAEDFFATLKAWAGPTYVSINNSCEERGLPLLKEEGLTQLTIKSLVEVTLAVPYNNAAFVDYENKSIEILRLVRKNWQNESHPEYHCYIYRQNASLDEIKDVVRKSPGDLLIKRLNFGKEEFAVPQNGKINDSFISAYEELFDGSAAFIGNDDTFCDALRKFCELI